MNLRGLDRYVLPGKPDVPRMSTHGPSSGFGYPSRSGSDVR